MSNNLVATIKDGHTVVVKQTNGSTKATFKVQGSGPGITLTHALIQGDEVHSYWNNGKVTVTNLYGSTKRMM